MVDLAPVNSDHVAWSGENPGIYLRETADGPWTGLATFFRVVVSPHGRGHAAVVLLDPTGSGSAERPNVCLTDNEPLARYLVANFVSHFGSFKERPGLASLAYQPAAEWRSEGNAATTWREIVRGPQHDLRLEWSDLEAPFLCTVPTTQTPTGAHGLITVFVTAKHATIALNGQTAGGRPFPRDAFGRPSTTAFLAFSETWLTA